MSLDVYLIETKPTEVFDANITHNLAKMASEVQLESGLTLYNVLWRPEEHGLKYARDIAELLDEGWNILLSDPVYFREFTPENHWGTYDGLCDFVYNYRNACWDNPDAEIKVSR